ncbi:hypothetical protein PVK06_036604 [Gossypium arboreum]|uniref:21 kDa seed protein-like n=1 Tax=Gossypium arboreum TaxID=29729 RepID=A0ABR0NJZ9_GOSAR|nr:hypothetical protein PVK06_036604 [Gossypium arboreum]
MKTTTASVFLLFIIFSVTPNHNSFANATNEPVLDIDGNEVQTGTPYYVVSWIWGAGGGGLALGRPRGNPCPEVVAQQWYSVWKVNDYDHSAGKWWVITDGVKGNPGANTLTSWFRIEKVSDVYYKFKYCPAVCETCPALCNEIGRDFDGEMVRLALSTGNGWPFYFKKVEKSAMEIQQVAHS